MLSQRAITFMLLILGVLCVIALLLVGVYAPQVGAAQLTPTREPPARITETAPRAPLPDGGTQITYLVHSPTEPEVITIRALHRCCPSESDGAGGYRTIVLIWAQACGARVQIAGQPVYTSRCTYLPLGAQ